MEISKETSDDIRLEVLLQRELFEEDEFSAKFQNKERNR